MVRSHERDTDQVSCMTVTYRRKTARKQAKPIKRILRKGLRNIAFTKMRKIAKREISKQITQNPAE